MPIAISSHRMRQIADKMSFPGRLQDHLSNALRRAGRTIPDAELEDQIQRGMLRARYYKLTRECDVARYIETVCLFLGGFTRQQHPLAARRILYNHLPGPEAKLAQFREWAERSSHAATQPRHS